MVERQVTNTPLQMLAIWNDEGMAAAASAFGERLAAAGDDAIEIAFTTLLQRAPNEAELLACRELLAAREVGIAEAALVAAPQPSPLALLATTLLSLDEALHRN